MIHRILNAPLGWALGFHGLATIAAFIWFQWIKARLDASYAASNHPVDYATGQTQFSGTAVKGYYAQIEASGTLDIYWQTQLIDFGFILGIFLLGWSLGTLIARFARPVSWGRRFALTASIAAMIAAICDAIENLISFVMLANPVDFADWIALPYSGFAVAKFALITLAMATLAISILLLAVGRALNRPKIA